MSSRSLVDPPRELPMLRGVIRHAHRVLSWAAPPLPPADESITAEVQRTLFTQALHLSHVVVRVAPPSAAAWAVLLWSRADATSLATWLALIIVADIGIERATAGHSRSGASIDETTRRLGMALIGSGVAWGSLPLLSLGASHTAAPLVGMMVLTSMAANAIFSAAVPRFFWSFQLSVTAVATAGLLLHGGRAALPVVAVLVYCTPFAAMLSRISRASDERGAYYAATAQRSADELKTVNRNLEYRASHDALTGLANRQEFARRLDAATAPGAPRPIGVLFMDLDRFKRVNDTLGHTAGDELLRLAAQRIRTRVRPGDVLARLGGDEFTVLVAAPCTPNELAEIANRILAAFDEPFMLAGAAHHVGISIGSTHATEAVTGTDLLRHADTALYDAKRAGRGCVCDYTDAG